MTLIYSTVVRVLSWDAIATLARFLVDELGTHEENGPNDGTCLKYQLVTGNGKGDSWCLSFLMWGVLQVVSTRDALRQVFGIITGSCEELRQVARKRGQLMPVGTAPQLGDIGLVVDTAADHAHHAFFVKDGPGEDDSMETLEGNSNDTGGSNGDGAYRRQKRFGVNDPTMQPGAKNHYELIRIAVKGDL
jgi:hypothetical protein